MIFSNYKQEIVAELNNLQPQCTTTALIVCKSIHFDDDIYRYITVFNISIQPKCVLIQYHCLIIMYYDRAILYHCISTTFERDFYARILPHNLAEIQSYPSLVLITSSEKGGFTVNLTGQQWRAVALDEAHEMHVYK